jgi:hypothetical protein
VTLTRTTLVVTHSFRPSSLPSHCEGRAFLDSCRALSALGREKPDSDDPNRSQVPVTISIINTITISSIRVFCHEISVRTRLPMLFLHLKNSLNSRIQMRIQIVHPRSTSLFIRSSKLYLPHFLNQTHSLTSTTSSISKTILSMSMTMTILTLMDLHMYAKPVHLPRPFLDNVS